jgi:hypothetical protein
MIEGFSRDREKQLISRGVPGYDLIPRSTRGVEVQDFLVKIEQDLGYAQLPTKVISTTKQYRALQSVMENPLHGSYVLGISSFPSDARAKHVAQILMSRGIDAWMKHHKPGRGLPLWHRVYGSFGDSLRDAKTAPEMPSMLIISNINDASTPQKLEKVRDLLERYADIPRIVVSGGAPPCNLFASKLFSPMRIGIYLGPSNMVKEM